MLSDTSSDHVQALPDAVVFKQELLRCITSKKGFFISDIARETGRSITTAIKYVHQMRDEGLIIPLDKPDNQGKGRRSIRFGILTKRHDPTRLVNPASGGNFFQTGDILDLHNYPQPKMKLRDNNRVNVLGEYGGIGMAVPGHNWTDKENFSYVALPSFDGVMNEYERLANILKEYIPLGFSAAVYTQTTDVEAETNGLMTYDRKVLKVDPERIRKINRSVIETLK